MSDEPGGTRRSRAFSLPGAGFALVGAELEQHAAGRGRMDERDLVAPRALARGLVDEAHARCLEACERGWQVVDLEAHVVEARAALVEELSQRLVSGGRAHLERG